jgi:thiamine biosynthesis lipoprotein ApbE
MVFALGLEKGMEFIEETNNTEAVFVLKEGKNYKVYVSSGLENKFEFNTLLEEKNYQYQGVCR